MITTAQVRGLCLQKKGFLKCCSPRIATELAAALCFWNLTQRIICECVCVQWSACVGVTTCSQGLSDLTTATLMHVEDLHRKSV